MSAVVVAACRTPWSVRHGELEAARPEVLLGAAMAATIAAGGGRLPDRILVACDESVGAQDHNIGRRVAVELGWTETPALTIDGHGATGLAAVALALELPGRTLVASVDACSMVPPGAGLVRDYGRPDRSEPELHRIERAVAAAGIERDALDRLAATMRMPGRGAAPLAPVSRPGGDVTSDCPDGREHDVDAVPLVADGVLTAYHVAEYADGAAAVLIDHTGGGRPLAATWTATGPDAHPAGSELETGAGSGRSDNDLTDDASGVLARPAGPVGDATQMAAVELRAVADVGTAALLGMTAETIDPRVSTVLATGSAPSGNGLRLLVDAHHAIAEQVRIVEIGSDGQHAMVTLQS